MSTANSRKQFWIRTLSIIGFLVGVMLVYILWINWNYSKVEKEISESSTKLMSEKPTQRKILKTVAMLKPGETYINDLRFSNIGDQPVVIQQNSAGWYYIIGKVKVSKYDQDKKTWSIVKVVKNGTVSNKS